MKVNFFYSTAPGRLLLKGMMHDRIGNLVSDFLRSPASVLLIKPFIHRNRIDMRAFRGLKFKSFADFFARKKPEINYSHRQRHLISPCDGMLSGYPIAENAAFFVKGSWYKISELVTEPCALEQFSDGFCLIYRLEASDYHHFCFIDDCYHSRGYFMPGVLHSVQPIACTKEPVFRLNRRVWSLMRTKHFGIVAQIEVGALFVGGILLEQEDCPAKRGDEMGHFELAGSTIIQLFTKETKQALKFQPPFEKAFQYGKEIRVRQGQMIGEIGKGKK